jgi:hypothetical protein
MEHAVTLDENEWCEVMACMTFTIRTLNDEKSIFRVEQLLKRVSNQLNPRMTPTAMSLGQMSDEELLEKYGVRHGASSESLEEPRVHG